MTLNVAAESLASGTQAIQTMKLHSISVEIETITDSAEAKAAALEAAQGVYNAQLDDLLFDAEFDDKGRLIGGTYFESIKTSIAEATGGAITANEIQDWMVVVDDNGVPQGIAVVLDNGQIYMMEPGSGQALSTAFFGVVGGISETELGTMVGELGIELTEGLNSLWGHLEQLNEVAGALIEYIATLDLIDARTALENGDLPAHEKRNLENLVRGLERELGLAPGQEVDIGALRADFVEKFELYVEEHGPLALGHIMGLDLGAEFTSANEMLTAAEAKLNSESYEGYAREMIMRHNDQYVYGYNLSKIEAEYYKVLDYVAAQNGGVIPENFAASLPEGLLDRWETWVEAGRPNYLVSGVEGNTYSESYIDYLSSLDREFQDNGGVTPDHWSERQAQQYNLWVANGRTNQVMYTIGEGRLNGGSSNLSSFYTDARQLYAEGFSEGIGFGDLDPKLVEGLIEFNELSAEIELDLTVDFNFNTFSQSVGGIIPVDEKEEGAFDAELAILWRASRGLNFSSIAKMLSISTVDNNQNGKFDIGDFDSEHIDALEILMASVGFSGSETLTELQTELDNLANAVDEQGNPIWTPSIDGETEGYLIDDIILAAAVASGKVSVSIDQSTGTLTLTGAEGVSQEFIDQLALVLERGYEIDNPVGDQVA